ncbi:MAG TPA: class I SAM-dependent methyltransferase [Actinomycetota bacterium]
MTGEREGRAQRAIAGTYSFLADRLYNPLIVHGGFRLFGGNLNELVFEQGRAAVAAANGGPILDMPVGTAYFTTRVAEAHDGLVVGVDIAEGMVRESARVARDAGLENLVTVCADAHRLPFPDGAFAAVLCSNGLQVIPGLRPVATELVRVLAPGGTLFVSVLLAPIGRMLPAGRRESLPTLLRPAEDVARELERAGLPKVDMRHERLAALMSARKPGFAQPRLF